VTTAERQQLFDQGHIRHGLAPGAAFFRKLVEVYGDAAVVVAGMVERFGVGLVVAQAAGDLDGDVFVDVPELFDQRVVIGQALFPREGAAVEVAEQPRFELLRHEVAKDNAQGIAAGRHLGVVFDDALIVQVAAGKHGFVLGVGLGVDLQKVALTGKRPVEKAAHGGHRLALKPAGKVARARGMVFFVRVAMDDALQQRLAAFHLGILRDDKRGLKHAFVRFVAASGNAQGAGAAPIEKGLYFVEAKLFLAGIFLSVVAV